MLDRATSCIKGDAVQAKVTITNRLARFGTIIVGIIAVIVLVIAKQHSTWIQIISTGRWVVFVFILLFFYWGWPEIYIDNQGIIIRNTLRTIAIPWCRYKDCRQDLGIIVITKDSVGYRASAAQPKNSIAQYREYRQRKSDQRANKYTDTNYKSLNNNPLMISWNSKLDVSFNADSQEAEQILLAAYNEYCLLERNRRQYANNTSEVSANSYSNPWVGRRSMPKFLIGVSWQGPIRNALYVTWRPNLLALAIVSAFLVSGLLI